MIDRPESLVKKYSVLGLLLFSAIFLRAGGQPSQPTVFAGNGSIVFSAPQGDVIFTVGNASGPVLISNISSSIGATQSTIQANAAAVSQQTSSLRAAIVSASVATSASLVAQSQGQSTALQSLYSNISQTFSATIVANQATQSNLVSSLALVATQATANISQARTDASAALVSALIGVNANTTSLRQNLTSSISATSSQLVAINASQFIVATQLQKALFCQSQLLVYNASTDTCVAPVRANVQLLPNDNVTFPCNSASNGVLTFNSQTNVLSLCSSKTNIPELLAPAALGTQQNPAMSCGDMYAQSMPSGFYFVGSPYRRVFCRNGVSSWQPPLDVLGVMLANFPFDQDVFDFEGVVSVTPTGNLTLSQGRVGSALVFSSNTSAAPFGQFLTLNIPGNTWTNSWTVACWAKFNSINRGGTGGTGNDNAILANYGASGNNQALHLGERQGRVQFGFYGNDLLGTIPLAAGVWTHIVWTYDGISLKSIYVNGVLDVTGAGADFVGLGTSSLIGVYGFNPASFMSGSLDDFLIFSKTLSAAQVFALFSSYRAALSDDIRSCATVQTRAFPNWFYTFPGSGGPPTQFCAGGLTSYFAPVDALMPLNYFAFNGNAADALSLAALVPRGTVTYSASAKQGQCVAFDGTTTYFDYPSISPFVFQNGFSISAWVYFLITNRGTTSSSDNSILGSGLATPTASTALHIGERANQVFFGFFSNDVASPPILTANTWYHIVWTSQADGCRSIYVNDQAQPLTVVSGTGRSFNGGLVAGCGAPFQAVAGSLTEVGTYTYGGMAMRMAGRIDELQVFPTTLYAADVALLYNYA